MMNLRSGEHCIGLGVWASICTNTWCGGAQRAQTAQQKRDEKAEGGREGERKRERERESGETMHPRVLGLGLRRRTISSR